MDYILGRMTSPEGAFYSTEDADSEGVEGKFYVWSLDEIRQILGEDRAKVFAAAYDVSEPGNWEHANILNLPKTLAQVAKQLGRPEVDLRKDLADDRAKLLAARELRVPPAKDTKVLTSWNGLMARAFGRGLVDPRRASIRRGPPRRPPGSCSTRCGRPTGGFLHSYKDGQAKFNAYLDDYTNLIDGLTRLFEATGEARWDRRGGRTRRG